MVAHRKGILVLGSYAISNGITLLCRPVYTTNPTGLVVNVNNSLKVFQNKCSYKANIPQLLAHNAQRRFNEMPFKTTSLFQLYLEVLKLCKHHPLHFSRTSAGMLRILHAS